MIAMATAISHLPHSRLIEECEILEKSCAELEEIVDNQNEKIDALQREKSNLNNSIRQLQRAVVSLGADARELSKNGSLGLDFANMAISNTVGTDALLESLEKYGPETILENATMEEASKEDWLALKDAVKQLFSQLSTARSERDKICEELDEYKDEVKLLRELVQTNDSMTTENEQTKNTGNDADFERMYNEKQTQLLQVQEDLAAATDLLKQSQQRNAALEKEIVQLKMALEESTYTICKLQDDAETSLADCSTASWNDESRSVELWRHLSLDEQRLVIRDKNKLVEKHGILQDLHAELKGRYAEACAMLHRLYQVAIERENRTRHALESVFRHMTRQKLLAELQANPLEDMFNPSEHDSSYSS